MRNDYRKKVKTNLEQRILAEIKTLPTNLGGRPLMLGEKIDDEAFNSSLKIYVRPEV